MKRTISVLALAGAALALAAPASTHNGDQTLIIRHQTRGCHTWSLNGGAYKAAQAVTLTKGMHLQFGNNDVMPHKLVKVAGPALKLPASANMNTMGAMTEIRFAKAGVYKLTTKAGEDYMKGMKTTGEDNVLTLKVTVR